MTHLNKHKLLDKNLLTDGLTHQLKLNLTLVSCQACSCLYSSDEY
jgi:hypothetical protein